MSSFNQITPEDMNLHAEWLESGGERGKRLEKPGRDFSGQDHSGKRFDQAHFQGTSFGSGDFSGAA